MPYFVFAAEAATVLLVGLFCIMLTADGLFGRLFELTVEDPVARVLHRSVQAAFYVGYPAFFAMTIYAAVNGL